MAYEFMLTRLTDGFSKKVENHAHAVALHFMHYKTLAVFVGLRRYQKQIRLRPPKRVVVKFDFPKRL